MQMSVQLKAAEDDNKSLQQALKSEIELRMQLEGTSVVYFCICVKCLWKIWKIWISLQIWFIVIYNNKEKNALFLFFWCLGGVVLRALDLRLLVEGSTPSHDTFWLFLR